MLLRKFDDYTENLLDRKKYAWKIYYTEKSIR